MFLFYNYKSFDKKDDIVQKIALMYPKGFFDSFTYSSKINHSFRASDKPRQKNWQVI